MLGGTNMSLIKGILIGVGIVLGIFLVLFTYGFVSQTAFEMNMKGKYISGAGTTEDKGAVAIYEGLQAVSSLKITMRDATLVTKDGRTYKILHMEKGSGPYLHLVLYHKEYYGFYTQQAMYAFRDRVFSEGGNMMSREMYDQI